MRDALEMALVDQGFEDEVLVLDLMAALNESVQKARASRAAGAGPAQVHELPKPTKKAAARKQPVKKDAAKKTAAKETGGKKSAGRRPRSA